MEEWDGAERGFETARLSSNIIYRKDAGGRQTEKQISNHCGVREGG